MRAFVIRGPLEAGVEEVAAPVAAAGQVVVEVARVGVCGTDVECFDGSMAYLGTGRIAYPLRIGHEWAGRVVGLGDGVDGSWLGRRTTGDTMLGCGRCRRCLAGRHHVCLELAELGFHPDWPGALAERVVVPADSLHALPDAVDDAAGAMVEPAGNALRAARATRAAPGDRVLVLGAGTIGLLVERFLAASGVEAHVVGRSGRSREAARATGTSRIWGPDELPDLPWDAVIDATDDPASPSLALDLVEPGGIIVVIGLAGEPSRIDTRTVTLKDASIVGILGGSAGLDGAIAAFADGSVDPRPLIGATIGLGEVADALMDLAAGRPATSGGAGRGAGAHPGPKLQVDPRG